MLDAKIDDKKCIILLKGIEDKSKDLSKAMKEISIDLKSSIEYNFEVGGRYRSPGSLIGGSKKWEISKYGGGRLIRDGHLSQSFTNSYDKNNATVGTNRVYAPILNFGGKTKPHEIWYRNFKALGFVRNGEKVHYGKVNHPGSNIPARPFMVVQPEDIEGFKETLIEHLTEGIK